MNSLYIGVGVAVILALVTALIGPLFVDWGTHRALFEAEASRIVGLPVKVLGDVDARLIPAPRVRFGDVVIGDLAHPIARVGRFELDLDVAGLIRGETRVSELALDRPALDFGIDADGRLEGLPRRAADLSAVRIETVRFVDGRATLTDRRSRTTWSATGIAGSGAVESLAGTWRLEANGLVEKRDVAVRLASRRGTDGPHLRIAATVGGGANLGGDLLFGGDAERPTLAGPVTLDLAAEATRPATKFSGRLDLDATAGRIDDLAVKIGEEPNGATFTGSARANFGAESAAEVSLRTTRLDLGGGPGGARARLASLAEAAREATAGLTTPRRTRATLAVDTAAIAGGLVSDLAIDVVTRPGGLTIERARAHLPGEGEVSFSGRLDLADRVLDGDGTLSAVAPETSSAWWTGESAGESRIGEASLSGAFTLTRDGFSGPDLALRLGTTEARGRVESRADGLVRLGLSAARLDGERFAALLTRLSRNRSLGGAAGLDLDFDVDRLDFGTVAARGARLSLHAGDGGLAIDRLALADLAGARVSASGRIADLAG
ncbi:MAG: AsmA family protein, partial [Phyllobacteriaceae bacterium]|nr:AsmA family protein [Phyllobacteriaceae bacterium]